MGGRLPRFIVGCMRNHQNWSSPEKLRSCMFIRLSGKWIVWTIVVIADILHQALTKISFSHTAIVYCCKISIDSIYWFGTQSPTEIRKMVAWLLAKNSFTWPTNVCKVSSKFPSCWIAVLKINLGVQVSICSHWNGGFYSSDILLWHTTHGNERQIIDW